jgi:SAM-dependent methyltransferase
MSPCRNCGSPALEVVLSLGEQPLANAYLASDELGAPEPRFPLELGVCPDCGLAQLTETVPPERLFRDYPYFSSVSDAFVDHARGLAERVTAEQRLDVGSLVLEVGSNDGYLLRHYAAAGVSVLGIDPARNIATEAERQGVPTISEFFGPDVARDLVAAGRRADVIHANNVLAHVPDLHGVVAGLATVLKPDGVAIIETPYVQELVERVEFDTIYHEHVFYYALCSLADVLGRHGLRVIDVERIPVHGGSLRVFAVPTAAPTGSAASVDQLLAEERSIGLDGPAYFSTLAPRVDEVGRELTGLLSSMRARGQRIAAYGAAAKGTVLLNAFGLGTETIEFVADRSPHKQGLHMPGVHIPIRPPEELLSRRTDICLLLAWNFADEIIEQQSAYRGGGGRFLIPIPQPRLAQAVA